MKVIDQIAQNMESNPPVQVIDQTAQKFESNPPVQVIDQTVQKLESNLPVQVIDQTAQKLEFKAIHQYKLLTRLRKSWKAGTDQHAHLRLFNFYN